MRRALKEVFYGGQRQIGRWGLRLRPQRPTQRFAVFCLHAITTGPSSEMMVTAARFRRQLEGLRAAGFECLTLEQALAAAGGATLAQPGFLLTFDDGYRSVYEEAVPVLSSLGMTATIFITPGFINGRTGPPWHSSNAALISEYRALRGHFEPMSWNQVRELAGAGVFEIGSHTMSHPLVGLLAEREIERELREARAELEQQLGRTVYTFSYPYGVRTYGAYSEKSEQLVRECGYRCSFTMEIERAAVGSGLYGIPRMGLFAGEDGVDAVAKAYGLYDWVSWAQRGYQRVFSNPHMGVA